MSAPSSLPHTLDNLCKADKDKLMEMIKQLNEVKKRCNALEQEAESLQSENQRLIGREDVMKAQIESMETKLFDAVEISKGSQARVDQLTSALQKSEAGRKSARARYREAQGEISSLRDTIRELKLKHERIHVDTSIQTVFNRTNRATNTDDTSINKIDQSVQCQAKDITRTQTRFTSYSTLQNTTMPPEALDSFESQQQIPTYEEFDDDISSLVALLNP